MVAFLIPMLFVVIAGFVAIITGIATPLLEIAAGIIAFNLFGFESTEIIHFLGEMGIISLMYLAGLEINVPFIRKEYKKSLGIGLASFFTPFLSILLVGRYILHIGWMPSILVGIALSSTSVAIVYPVLLQKGKLDTTHKALLSASMITDILGIIMLSIFYSDVSYYTIVLLILLFILAGPIRKLGTMTFARIERKGSVGLRLKMVLLILLGVQVVAPLAGVEAVLIAFLLGVLTSELMVKFNTIEKQLKTVTFAFLTPFFFFTIGLSVNIFDIASSILFLVVFTVIGYLAHFAGTYYSVKFLLQKKAFYAGNLFNSKLSIGIITAAIGLEAGILTQNIYVAIIGSIILCTFISSIMTHERFTLEG